MNLKNMVMFRYCKLQWYNPEEALLSAFVLNIAQQDDIELKMDFRSFSSLQPLEHSLFCGTDLLVCNSFDQPEKVKSCQVQLPQTEGQTITVQLPKLS